MRFILSESDDTTETVQAISFTTPPASLIFRLKKERVIGDQYSVSAMGLSELCYRNSLGFR